MRPEEIRRELLKFTDEIPDDLLGKLVQYLELLQRWNARTNLSAIREPEEIVRRHFGESLAVADWLAQNRELRGKRLFDFGSGAGFPGAVIALRRTELRVTLIESQGKKATFLRELVRALELQNCEVFAGRAEGLDGRAEIVTMRAVDRSEAMTKVADGLLVPRGTLVLMLGARQAFQGEVHVLRSGVRIGVHVVE